MRSQLVASEAIVATRQHISGSPFGVRRTVCSAPESNQARASSAPGDVQAQHGNPLKSIFDSGDSDDEGSRRTNVMAIPERWNSATTISVASAKNCSRNETSS